MTARGGRDIFLAVRLPRSLKPTQQELLGLRPSTCHEHGAHGYDLRREPGTGLGLEASWKGSRVRQPWKTVYEGDVGVPRESVGLPFQPVTERFVRERDTWARFPEHEKIQVKVTSRAAAESIYPRNTRGGGASLRPLGRTVAVRPELTYQGALRLPN